MSATYPKVTIVTPSYNQGEFLERTIQSVLTQDYPNLEYIIIDGGSTDGSIDIIRKYSERLAYWTSAPDKGQSDAVNKGWRHSTGEILGWLNSDDIYQPGSITAVVEFFATHPDVDMAYGDCGVIDETGRVIGQSEPAAFDLNDLINYKDFIPQPSTFFKRHVLDSVGYLDPDLHYSMDYDLWIRIGKHFQVRYCPKLLASIRVHRRSKSACGPDVHSQESIAVSRRQGGHRFSRLYFRHMARFVYRRMPQSLRSLAKNPWLLPLTRLLR